MSSRVLNTLLGATMLIAILLSFAAARDYSRPNLEALPDMYHGPTYQAFEANPNFRDGKTLQLPAEGSIPRGLMPLHYERTEIDALRAGEELVNPIDATDESQAWRGAEQYAVFCQQCHGPSGAGDGMVARRGYPPPPSLASEHAVRMKDGQMFHVITYGQGNMPAHAALVSRNDRWRIISHIRTLQAGQTNQPGGATTE